MMADPKPPLNHEALGGDYTKLIEEAYDWEACDRGICSANKGHDGTCAQASGWDETPTAERGSSVAGDYTKLIEDAHRWHDRDDGAHRYTDANALVLSLADAVESLVAENEKLRPAFEFVDALNGPLDQIVKFLAERDALRAQLDSMTIEWGTLRQDDYAGAQWHQTSDSEADARQALVHSSFAVSLAKRTIGPWVEVSE